MIHLRLLLLLAGYLVCSMPGRVFAKSWNINSFGTGDAPSIQAGIDSASAGDSVLVSAGTYLENIDFKGKAIVVQGAGAEFTTLDGSGQAEACVLFASGETERSVLSGFTLTGGRGHQFGSTTSLGGAIYGIDSEPVIENNIISDNQAVAGGNVFGRGGGIYFVSGGSTYRPQIIGNQILQNKAMNGAGIGCRGTQSPVIKNNIISRNETTSGDGAGIWLFTRANGAIITNNQITNNLAGDHAGAMLAVQELPSGSPINIEISWNLITGNKALWGGIGPAFSAGGLYLDCTSAWVHHNTIAANLGYGPDSTSGGGIVLYRPGNPVVEKNIIALTQSGGGIWCGGGVTPTIRNNLAWQNVGGHGVGDCATWWQADGNIVADPYFCDPASGDYEVAQNSPALTHVAGPLGAFYLPGCGPVSVERVTWGSLKARFLSGR